MIGVDDPTIMYHLVSSSQLGSSPIDVNPPVPQKKGIIQHILSSVGDLLVLGGDSIITDLNYGSGACSIYDTNAILRRWEGGRPSWGSLT